MNATFTKRRLDRITVKEVGKGSLSTTEGTGFGIPRYVAPLIKAGDVLFLELYRFNDIAGLMNEDGEFLFHRTDEYFATQHERFIAEMERKNNERLEKHEQEWQARTDALPERYRTRLERFLTGDNGEDFKRQGMGWGYELIVCELAVLYEKSDGKDSDEVNAFAKEHGTSGNQHAVARAWAKHKQEAI